MPNTLQQEDKTILQTSHLHRTFGNGANAVQALEDINLTISYGKFIVLKGPSGSGKTTLINILGALDSPTKGRVHFQGVDLYALNEKARSHIRRTQVGFIFQSSALMSHMTAYENVEFGLRIAGIKQKRFKQLATDSLNFLGMIERMNHLPAELSGGEQQRVAIARAIAHKPRIVLADEPTAEVDSKMSQHIIQSFKDLVRTENMTIVITTHDPAVMELADYVYELEDGRIVNQT